MIPFAALLMIVPAAAPQGDGVIDKLLRAEKVAGKLPKRKGPSRSKSPRDVIVHSGTSASELAASLLIPVKPKAKKPDAIELMSQGIVLFDVKRNTVQKVRLRTMKDIETFFAQSHRDVRKALGFEINFTRTIPQLHGVMEKILADSKAGLSEDDQKVIDREWRRAKKVDIRAMHKAALGIVAMAFKLAGQKAMLARQQTKRPRRDVTGSILVDRELAFGRIVIGGPGRNVYDCSQIAVIIDLGGNDEYRGAAGGAHVQRRYSVCIDLDGDDTYRGGNGALGSATYGLGVCIDMAGDDDYEADKRSAGFAAAGVGVFLDVSGDDKMQLGAHSGGVGLMGMGHCFDLAGDDEQRGGRSCFGVGLAGGLGHFVDVSGKDQRYLTGIEGKANLGFGAARGFSASRPGGLGVCIDHAGDDTYTGGVLALGVGDLGGLGVCLDLGGDDSYIAGGMSLGASARGGVGIMIDVKGKDHYFAPESMAVAGVDGSAFFEDLAGDDIYEVSGAGMGRSAAGGMSFFQDLGGKNRFRLKEGSLSFLPVDPGGFALFRSLGKGDTYSPATRDPGAKGRRIETKKSFELHLTR
jgi:hypothetical protein